MSMQKNTSYQIALNKKLTRKYTQGPGQEFDTKYHILHDFRTSTPFKENSSDHFKDLHKMSI